LHHNIVNDTMIKWEEGTLSLIIENLLSNAIKFSRHNEIPYIEIGCDENSIWIEDNGVWIPEENIESIFNKFYRVDTGKEWFWVGLFITQRIVELYGWTIEVSSEVWTGTKFTIKF
jgi:two-component system phosphate regulon sensor histidine kinase PhoR